MVELRSLAQPNSRFAGDDGSPDPLVRAAIAKANSHTGYIRALVALCTARLLLPIVASGDEGGDAPDPDRHAEMAAVTLKDDTGSYLLAFTGYDSLRAWQADARPVPSSSTSCAPPSSPPARSSCSSTSPAQCRSSSRGMP